MGLNGIKHNLKKYGIIGTWKIYRRRDIDRKHVAKLERERIMRDIEDGIYDPSEISEYLEMLKDPKKFKSYNRKMRYRLVQEELPEIYSEYSKAPVEDKVIIMEDTDAPSPSSGHLGKVLEEQGKYEVVYMGLGARKVSFLRYYDNIREFIREMATARAVFISAANDYLSFFDVRPETKIIQLWHGVGMFKKVGFSTAGSKGFGPTQSYREKFNQYRNYSYVTIASKDQAWMFEDAMHLTLASGVIQPIGTSRTDLFFDEGYRENALEKLHSEYPETEGKKIILYAPTFRGSVNNALMPDRIDIDRMGRELSDEYVLLIKHHGLCQGKQSIPEKWKDTFCFDVTGSKDLTIEELIDISDVCITDYSSVAFEFSIFERPILFFAYDLESYLDQRGIYMDYVNEIPGPLCRTTDEMTEYIKGLPETFDGEKMAEFKRRYAEMCDGHATERTIALIEKERSDE